MSNRKNLSALFVMTALLGITSIAAASSHREAPAIAEDQYADNTDVYAFISPTDSNNLVLVANYVPLLIPSAGPNFYRFSDTVLYEIRLDNDGDAIPDIAYEFRFRSSVENGATFLYNVGPVASPTDPNLNVRQNYEVRRRDLHTRRSEVVFSNVPVAPWNVGSRSFPGDSYSGVADMAVTTEGGRTVFAGPRDEPFFVDLHVFDLLGVAGAPTTDGINVMSIVLEIPINEVAQGGSRPAAGTASLNSQVGVYARASRRHVRILRRGLRRSRRGHRRLERNFGRWQQVSRLGWPLINEVVIPLQDKDFFNRTSPVNDVANFGSYILNPELNGLLSAVLGLPCEPNPAGGRVDIVGLLSPNGTAAADLLRINIEEGQSNADSGFPNGRALSDDVTDTLLTVICNGGIAVGDGVDGNDLPFSPTFPYLASPHSGNP